MHTIRVSTSCPSGDHIYTHNIPEWLKPNNTYVARHYRRYCLNLTSIPSDIPEDAIEVKLYGNPIKTVRANTFPRLVNCTVLGLGWNEIIYIEVQAFNGMEAVENLFLHDNMLTKVTKGMFLGLSNCVGLMLQFNLIDTIGFEAFTGLNRLRQIHIHDNRLIQLSQGMFANLRTLQLLNADANSIHTVHRGALSDLPQLKQLGLRINGLTTLSWTAFISKESTGSLDHPVSLQLNFERNPMNCNKSLCWIWKGELDGWLTWWGGDQYAPHCHNYPTSKWSRINLDCKQQGQCVQL